MTENLEYKGKKYPIKLGYYALKHTSNDLKQEKGIEVVNLEDILAGEMVVYEYLLWYGLLMGARLHEKELELQRDEMEFFLDAVFFDFIALVPKFFPGQEENTKKEGESEEGK